ncbi:MAG TPA: hypothetical protein VEA44_10520 [Caulobacter sp.]|nr:hypothetical protein [Caulobacter sp.]
MGVDLFADRYPDSPAYRGLQPLRIPSGWTIGWNTLDVAMEQDLSGIGGSSQFNATNEGRRFNIDVEFLPEFDPQGAFHITVTYQPWPRSGKGRRLKSVPFAFDINAEVVHTFETRSYPELVRELEHWIARCSVWAKEQN